MPAPIEAADVRATLAATFAALWVLPEMQPHAGPVGGLAAVNRANALLRAAVYMMLIAASSTCNPSFLLLNVMQWAPLTALAACVAFNIAAVAALSSCHPACLPAMEDGGGWEGRRTDENSEGALQRNFKLRR